MKAAADRVGENRNGIKQACHLLPSVVTPASSPSRSEVAAGGGEMVGEQAIRLDGLRWL